MQIHKRKAGFTLIELLVVIAVVGVLAGAIIVVINPSEQFARAHDAARKNNIRQLGEAIVANVAIRGTYQVPGGNWMDTLKGAGELKAVPQEITPRPSNVLCWDWTYQNNYCYYAQAYGASGQVQAWVWTNVESKTEMNKCGVTISSLYQGPYYVYDTINNKTCLKCLSDQGSNSWAFAGACHPGE